MTSNFAFLEPEWRDLHEAAIKAERLALADPRASCFYARRALGPGGHLNIPHLWPGQSPPPGRRRNGGKLGRGRPPRNPGCGLSQSPALAYELEQVTMVHQAVE